MIGLITICMALLITCLSAQSVQAEKIDSIRSEIEVYGNVQFLMRIGETEKFATRIYSNDDKDCIVDHTILKEIVRDKLAQLGRLQIDNSGKVPFRLDVDYFGGLDTNGHCMISYETYLTRNYNSDNALTDIVERHFEYENSTPLLKVNGIIHVSQKALTETMSHEIGETIEIILKALNTLQQDINKNLPQR